LPEPASPTLEPEHVTMAVVDGKVMMLLDHPGFVYLKYNLWLLMRLSELEDVSIYSEGDPGIKEGECFGYCEITHIPAKDASLRVKAYGGNRRIGLEND